MHFDLSKFEFGMTRPLAAKPIVHSPIRRRLFYPGFRWMLISSCGFPTIDWDDPPIYYPSLATSKW